MKKYQDLIDRLADGKYICPLCKREVFLDHIYYRCSNCMDSQQNGFSKSELEIKPILIGDIFSKMSKEQISMEGHKVMWLWQPCGFTKSLQEILSENVEDGSDGNKYLKPEATELFEFIIKLKLKYI